ncbi:MAG: hypothetical protein ACI9J3_000825 [Parvicellaceae bacterium]|jgi:hypothetical protein
MLFRTILFISCLLSVIPSKSQSDTVQSKKAISVNSYDSIQELDIDLNQFVNYRDHEKDFIFLDRQIQWHDPDLFLYDSVHKILLAEIDHNRALVFWEGTKLIELNTEEVSFITDYGCDYAKVLEAKKIDKDRFALIDFRCYEGGTTSWSGREGIQVWNLTKRELIFEAMYLKIRGGSSYELYEEVDEETGKVYEYEKPCCWSNDSIETSINSSVEVITIGEYTRIGTIQYFKQAVIGEEQEYGKGILKPGKYILKSGRYIRE